MYARSGMRVAWGTRAAPRRWAAPQTARAPHTGTAAPGRAADPQRVQCDVGGALRVARRPEVCLLQNVRVQQLRRGPAGDRHAWVCPTARSRCDDAIVLLLLRAHPLFADEQAATDRVRGRCWIRDARRSCRVSRLRVLCIAAS